MRHLLIATTMLAACGQLEEPNYAPISSADDDGTDDGTPMPVPEVCTVERLLVWTVDGESVPTPRDVEASYVGDAADIPVECGEVDGEPACWVACGPEGAPALVLDWRCDSVVHEVVEAPLPNTIELDGCPLGDTSSTSGSSDTGSGGSDSTGSTTGDPTTDDTTSTETGGSSDTSSTETGTDSGSGSTAGA